MTEDGRTALKDFLAASHLEGRSVAGRQDGKSTRVFFLTALTAFTAFTALTAAPLHAQSLGKRLDRRLAAEPWSHNLWGIAVMDDRGHLLYGHNPEKLFMPASNTKLVVTTVASALLPPDWTVKTSLYGTGPLVNGVLQGDLILYGRGDPTFSERCYAVDTLQAGVCDADPFAPLRQLAQGLKARGVRAVQGDLVGDGSYFAPPLVNPGWETYDLNWWYAAPVSGLGFNDNSLNLTWGPGAAENAPAGIVFAPDLGDVVLENRTITGPAGSETTIDFFRQPGTLHLWAEGAVALDHRGRTEYFALPDPDLYTARALRQALAEAGIAVLGTTRSTTDSLQYRDARGTPPLAEVTSRPFKDWIFPILNTSQNWFAEMVLKQLGKQFGAAGSWTEGLRVERRFLVDSVGLDSTLFSLSDGSGLSSSNLVSPLAFTRILQFIRHHPHWSTFAAGLPRSGATGSLRHRFVGTPLEGRVQAKTGSISRVNTLSGFIELTNGRFLTFSVEANHHAQHGNAMIAQIDSLVVEMGKGR